MADRSSSHQSSQLLLVQVDVIIPVHNSAETVEGSVKSALRQILPNELRAALETFHLQINVCCYDDGSTDSSWEILTKLYEQYSEIKSSGDGTRSSPETNKMPQKISSRLLIEKSKEGIGRGAGYARNRAVDLSQIPSIRSSNKREDGGPLGDHFLCLLDSDDLMDPTRVAEQVHGMMMLSKDDRGRTIMGCRVVRDPPDSTWHYMAWANNLSNDRLSLERFREVTLLQPTWMMCRSRFNYLGGYIEAPKPQPQVGHDTTTTTEDEGKTATAQNNILQLIHPTFDTPQTLRLAEDLRFYHAHLYADGLLRLHKSGSDPDKALVTYRHRLNQSQSYQTSRKLLLHLQALAFEVAVLQDNIKQAQTSIANPCWTAHDGKFVVWGAGRDGKDFVKALSEDARKRVYCFVDVDRKKIQIGFYANRELALKIPIFHFSLLAKDPLVQKQLLEDDTTFGQINKSKDADDNQPEKKKPKVTEKMVAASPQAAKSATLSLLPELPVVVCVALNRTNGALEKNVAAVGRVEGESLWHFS